MSYAGQFSTQRVWRVLLLQALLGLAVAAGAFFLAGWPSAVAAVYGCSVALVNLALLVWRMHRGKHAHTDAHRHLRSAYLASAERLAMVIVLLAIGFGVLELAPFALLAGFIAGQLGLLISGFLGGNV